jgi:tetratricopeptide (TPR) repeat protein
MKKLIVPLTICLTLCSAISFAGDNKKAITEVIENEYQAYVDRDLDTWSDYWVHEPSVNVMWVGKMGYEYIKTYDSLYANVKKWMAKEDMGGTDIDKEVLDVNVSGDIATVYLKEYETWKFAGEEKKFKSKSTYVLKNVDGNWKFVSMASFNKTSFDNDDFTSEWIINMEGYKLLWRDELDKAIKVFELNTQLYPEGFNTWDSLAEAYMKKGDKEKAIKYYSKSLALNAKNKHAQEMIDKMKSE